MSYSLEELREQATPKPPWTAEQVEQLQVEHPGALPIDWSPPAPRIEPENQRERQLYMMGYYDGVSREA